MLYLGLQNAPLKIKIGENFISVIWVLTVPCSFVRFDLVRIETYEPACNPSSSSYPERPEDLLQPLFALKKKGFIQDCFQIG